MMGCIDRNRAFRLQDDLDNILWLLANASANEEQREQWRAKRKIIQQDLTDLRKRNGEFHG